MSLKSALQLFYFRPRQLRFLVSLSRKSAKIPLFGKTISLLLDKYTFLTFGIDYTATTLQIDNLVVGHTSGVVLGGNGIRCKGTLHLSSGVVFGRRYAASDKTETDANRTFFDFEGEISIGANTVIYGPCTMRGPVTIGAMSLVTQSHLEPGVYVGIPAKKIRDL